MDRLKGLIIKCLRDSLVTLTAVKAPDITLGPSVKAAVRDVVLGLPLMVFTKPQ